MIRLTGYHNGSPIYVPADVVIKENYKYEYGSKNALPVTEYKPIDGAMVVYDGIEYAVKESQEEVARKVLEWQYFYERFKAFARAWAAQIDEKVSLTMYDGMESAREELRRLAGLEDMNHDP